MSKYAPLTDFLAAQELPEVSMSFADIEAVIGTHLPPSKRHPAWWSNNASNNVMTRAWLAAGFETERVDIVGERLVFCRRRAAPSPPLATEPETGEGFFARIRERLGGTVRVAPGWDLTAPTGERWDAEV